MPLRGQIEAESIRGLAGLSRACDYRVLPRKRIGGSLHATWISWLPIFGLRPRAGASAKGCNMLSFRKQNYKANCAFSVGVESLEGRVVLTTFHVNTFADTVAANLKTGRDSTNHISLCSAIMAADANPNSSDTIVLPAGTYNLTIAPTGDDGPSSGDLDILVNKKLTIKGSTHGGQTIINGNNLDRVFLTLSGNVAMSNVVIEHGQAVDQGGGLFNDGANDDLTSVQFVDNIVVGQAGAIGVPGAAGQAGGAGGAGVNGEGGAICSLGGSLTLANCALERERSHRRLRCNRRQWRRGRLSP